MKAKPKKKTRAPKKKTTARKPKGRAVAARKAVAKRPKRKAVARRKVVAKPKRKPVAKRRVAPRPARPSPAKRKAPAAKPARAVQAKPARRASSPKPRAAAVPRRDGTGHLSARYAADLRERSKESAEPKDADSFVHGSKSHDPLAEELGEEFVKTALSGEDGVEDALDQVVEEERGGPFIETTAGTEFADGTDASNPKGAKPEPFPTT